jgi:MFS family permease
MGRKARCEIKEHAAEENRIEALGLGSVVWLVYVPTFLLSVGWGMVLPIIPLLARGLGASLGLTGLIVAAKGLGTLILDLPAGLLVTSLGKKKTILLASVGACAVALMTGFTGNLALFAALTFMLGGFHSMWIMTQLAVLRDTAPAEQRGRAIAFLGGVSRVGTFVGPIVGGFLAKLLGFSAAYFGQAVISFVALALLYVYSRKVAWEPLRRIGVNLYTRIGRNLADHRRSFMTAGSAVITLQLLRAGRQILFPLWGDAIGLDVAAIGLIIGLSSAVDMTLFYPAGMIMDKLGRKWTAVPALFLLSTSLVLIPLTKTFAALMMVGLLSGLANGLSSGLGMTIGADLAPDRGTGDFLGVWRLIGDIGTASGPVIIGAVAQAFTLSLSPVVAACIGLGGAFIMLFVVGETLKKSPTAKTAQQAKLGSSDIDPDGDPGTGL